MSNLISSTREITYSKEPVKLFDVTVEQIKRMNTTELENLQFTKDHKAFSLSDQPEDFIIREVIIREFKGTKTF